MSNRMSVLSRRLGRLAVCFSVVTFCFLVIGLYAHANNKGQAMFFVAVLASECFFATFFLWLAHGFAWAMIPENPAGAKNSADLMAPEKSAEVMTPEALRPAEVFKRTEVMKPAEEKAITPQDSPAKYTITGRRIL
jgi:hypothetical protein